jgi:gelsolin
MVLRLGRVKEDTTHIIIIMTAPREKLDISETNCALLGSDLEKKVKLAAAQQEPAWAVAGKQVGIEVWRIEKFHVVPWPADRYGEFHDGDSYIVLHTKKAKRGSENLEYDVHFWLGAFTTQDEAGTAAIKTVEVDDFFNGVPVQYREVQGWESEAFLRLFPDGVHLIPGGVDSGFRHVEDKSARKRSPKMFHISGPTMKTVRVTYVRALTTAALSQADCFVVDEDDRTIYVFQGATCSPGEAAKASRFANVLAEKKIGGSKVVVVNSDDAPEAFWGLLEGSPADVPAETCVELTNGASSEAAVKQQAEAAAAPPTLVHISDASGALESRIVATGAADIKAHKLDGGDCYVLIDGLTATCWVGAGANAEERRGAMQRTQLLVQKMGSPMASLSRVTQGHETSRFAAMVFA